jgi:cytosine/adenosine deaminase-related metal-dependent hydrolase
MNSAIRKYTADYIFDGTTLHEGRVLVTGTGGEVVDLISRGEAGEDVLVLPGLLSPGWINAHCHLELSHMKGMIPRHTGLVDFLLQVVGSRGTQNADKIFEAAANAADAMVREGIVGVGDIANTTDTLPVKQHSALWCHTFVEALGIAPDKASASMARAQQTWQAYRDAGLAASIVPHAPYSVSPLLLESISRFDRGAVISIHNQESAEEDKLFRGEVSDFRRLYAMLGSEPDPVLPPGTSSLQHWLPFFSPKQTLITVHNTYTSEPDIEAALASASPVYWCLCPNANAYIENRMPPLEQMLHHRLPLVLGTDSLASNDQLSLLEEMKTLQRNFPALPLATMLGWVTRNGAAALRCDDRLGSFTPGKKPGLVHIDPVAGTCGQELRVTDQSRARRVW